jgi:ubiquinone/menaquinone biosynthesis C-methylase UbiE
MNYGYDEYGFSPELSKEYENERYPAQLYHHTATQVDISNIDLLEAGSGRGGGASYVQRHLNTRTVTGLDISSDAIKISENSFNIPGLSFVQGDSENLPFEKNSFDIVLNVESSHCYGDIEKFFVEVWRVLKNGGYFLWCDFRTNKEMDLLFETFLRSGFIIEKEKDITKNIMSALDIVTPIRKQQIEKHVPKVIRGVFESYAGIAGGSVNNAFLNGDLVYKSAALKAAKD